MPEPIPIGICIKLSKKSIKGNFQGQVSKLDDLLSDAIDKQVIADVQVGAFLSGGMIPLLLHL